MSFDVLARFVDRKSELARFHRMLSGGTDKRILLVTDAREKGKTHLLIKICDECERQSTSVPVALVDFDRDRVNVKMDYLGVARAISRYLGESCTPRICACDDVNFRRGPVIQTGAGDGGGVDLGKRTRLDKAEVSAAGRDYIHDVHINYTEAPPTADQIAKRMADMGRALRDDLAELAEQHNRVVLLMDTFEQADEETCAWLERWLLEPMRSELAHLLLVVAGRPQCRSSFELPALWSGLITSIDRLTPFSDDDIRDHYRQRGIPISEGELSLLLDLARPSPAAMAQIGDSLEQTRGGEWR